MTQIYEVPFIIDPLVVLSKNTKDLLLRTTSGTNAEIIKDWKFDIAGNLTLPAGGNILNSSGGSILAENILDNYVRGTYPDLRKCLNQLQVNSSYKMDFGANKLFDYSIWFIFN